MVECGGMEGRREREREGENTYPLIKGGFILLWVGAEILMTIRTPVLTHQVVLPPHHCPIHLASVCYP